MCPYIVFTSMGCLKIATVVKATGDCYSNGYADNDLSVAHNYIYLFRESSCRSEEHRKCRFWRLFNIFYDTKRFLWSYIHNQLWWFAPYNVMRQEWPSDGKRVRIWKYLMEKRDLFSQLTVVVFTTINNYILIQNPRTQAHGTEQFAYDMIEDTNIPWR